MWETEGTVGRSAVGGIGYSRLGVEDIGYSKLVRIINGSILKQKMGSKVTGNSTLSQWGH